MRHRGRTAPRRSSATGTRLRGKGEPVERAGDARLDGCKCPDDNLRNMDRGGSPSSASATAPAVASAKSIRWMPSGLSRWPFRKAAGLPTEPSAAPSHPTWRRIVEPRRWAAAGLLLSTTLAPAAAHPIEARGSEAVPTSDPDVFPESVSSDRSGNLYVGSLLRPTIYRRRPGGTAAERWIDLSSTGSTSYGILADDRARTLWACTVEHPLSDRTPTLIATRRSTLRAFDLETGTPAGAWPLPGSSSACNDVTVAGDGRVYVSDSGDDGGILRLSNDRKRLETIYAGPETRRVDGIVAWRGRLIFASVATGRVYEMEVSALGAGRPREIATSRPLLAPDGLRRGAGRLFVAESGAGCVDELARSATGLNVVPVRCGLDHPTSVAAVGGTLWIAELRTGLLTDPSRPDGTSTVLTGVPVGSTPNPKRPFPSVRPTAPNR